MSALLELRGIRKAFAGQWVLDDIDLSLAPGEIVSLLGPSGCGKSTLLRIAAGLDQDFTGGLAHNPLLDFGGGTGIGVVFQEPRLLPWLNVAQNVGFADGRGADAEWIEQLLEDVGLAGQGGKLPKQLSGGMAQRVAIARGLYQRPQVLLLDEPTTFLDVCHQFELLDLLQRLNEEDNLTVVLVLHEINHALRYAKRVAVVKDGRLAALGSPWDVVTPELLRQVFRVQGEVVADSDGRAALLMQGLDRKSEQENRRT